MTAAMPRRRRRLYQFMNPIMIFRVRRLGLGGRGADLLRILAVRGRISGSRFETPVRMTTLDDKRYVMTMTGDTQWARNLRAAGEGELIIGSRVERVRAPEITGAEKAEILTQCCLHPAFRKRALAALSMVVGHKADKVTPQEIQLLAQIWFVFRCESV
jgi:deazaflavin-dependent oxidoreductase (nitroreductase family)